MVEGQSGWHDIRHRELLEKCPPDVEPADWKVFREHYRQASQFEELDAPPQLDIELNGGCNMSCPFCLHGYLPKKRPNKHLPVEDYKRLIREAVAMGVRGLKLNYINEPMLRTDLEELIRAARDEGMLNVYLTTNGTLLTRKRWQSMLDSGIQKVFISIDAATSEVYSKQRLSGRFNAVVRNVLGFVDARNERGRSWPLVRVSFLRNNLNRHEASAFWEFWRGRVDMVAFQKMNELPDRDTGLRPEDEEPQQRCGFPFKQLVVDHEGDILPCCKLAGKHLAVGNIADMTLAEAWGSEQMKTLRKLHRQYRGHENPTCRRCMAGA